MQTTDILLGVAVGDALGVPFEFSSREKRMQEPAEDMIGYGSHNQPPGTWSDDASLTFCLADALCNGYNLAEIARNFVKWKCENYWTARGRVFDIGMTTARAIARLRQILAEGRNDALLTLHESAEEFDNGNGSLMRILPLLFHIKGKDLEWQFARVWEVSALTHRHIRAAMSCMIYLNFAEHLLLGKRKETAYENTRSDIKKLWKKIDFPSAEREHFKRLIQTDIRFIDESRILSGGYVIESLEASFWCFLRSSSFKNATLSAVNLGHDTDTTGAIVGGLAGLHYGSGSIPQFWKDSLARYEDIETLGKRLHTALC